MNYAEAQACPWQMPPPNSIDFSESNLRYQPRCGEVIPGATPTWFSFPRIERPPMQVDFTIYGQADCKFCDKAKALLTLRERSYEYIDVTFNPGLKKLLAHFGQKTVPVVFEGNRLIGGFDRLEDYL